MPMEALRIGEVARRTGLTIRTLRHYDDLGLLVPSGRSSGDQRLYADADLRRLLAIQHLKSLGLGLAEVGRALDDPGFDAATALARHVALVEQRLAAERELLNRLRRLGSTSDWQEVLEAIRFAEALRHPDASVRLRATLGAPTGVTAATLVDQLVSDPNEGVREGVVWALARHGRAATDALLARVRDRDPGVRVRVAHALSKLGDPAAVGALAVLLLAHDPAVAAKAAFALGRLGGDEALDALAESIGVAEPEVRDAVGQALAGLGASALERVAEQLADQHPSVREHAAEVLGLLEEPAAAGPLAAALSAPDAGVRFTALLGLGRLGTEEAGHAIEGALGSPEARTRLLAERLVSDRRAGGPPAG